MKQTVRPVRVVQLITDLDIGGAEVMLARVLERMDSTVVHNTVVCLGCRGALAERIERNGVAVFSLAMKAGRLNPFALLRLVALLRQLHPDVLQTWLYHADLAGIVAGRLAGVPRIAWNIRCAELDPRDHPRSLPALLRVLAIASPWSSAIVCNSNAGRQAHERLGYSANRWLLIPNGFDTDGFRPCPAARAELRRELGIADAAPVVGLLARLHPMKDHATFVRASAIVARAREDVHFVAAGRGVAGSTTVSTQLSELGIADRVHLLPERRDAARFLAALDVAVSSSYGEAFPNVIGEAMACGIPCVVTDVGESASIVGDAGAVVPPRDPGKLASAILQFLALDDPARISLADKARQRIISRFSLDRATRQYEQLYLDLASGLTASA